MPINSFLYPGAKTTTAYEVANSLRFNDGSSDNLTRTPSSASNRKTWTWSGWVKRSTLGANQDLFNAYNPDGFWERFYFTSGDILEYDNDISGSDYTLNSEMLFRDVSAWYHLVFAKDTTQSTEANRLKIYVNGTQITLTEVALGYPPQNTDGDINNTLAHSIGKLASGSYFDGYMAEVVFVDGEALTPTSFGEFDEDSPTIWKPKSVSGLTFGTNGFYLDFEDSSALGADVSGSSNSFTVNNLTAIDQSTDTCTNNFATLNPLASSIDTSNNVLKEGNLQVDHGDNNYDGGTATFGFLNNMTGKWYWEIRNNANTGSSNQGEFAGISYIGDSSSTVYDDFGTESYLLATTGSNIIYKKDNSAVWTLTSPSGFSAGDIINVALDLDNSKIWFGLNGTFYDMSDGSTDGDPTGSNGATVSRDYDYLPYFRIYGNTAQLDFNFGSPAFSISSGNADANGHGNFEYSVPTGYFALNSKNLAEFG
tara:strand:+ start:356 stop:1798 length:1443 start_codon:yes stop_codon:yes gene_type:complete